MLKCFLTTLLSLSAVLFACKKSSPPPPPSLPLRVNETLSIDNLNRYYTLNLPPKYSDTAGKIPLVIILHGFGGKASQAEADYGFTEKAGREQFAVVYPEGVQSTGALGFRSWNAGSCCDYASDNNINDVKFIDSLISRIIITYPKIDRKKIYITGISNGGMMAYRLAADLGHKIAAIAPVAATMMYPAAAPVRRMPVLHIHSELDTKVPYDGGIGLGGYDFEPVDTILKQWAGFNGCSYSTQVISEDVKFSHLRFILCDPSAPIDVYKTKDGGHSWPGGVKPRDNADAPSTAFNATDLIWEFFRKHQLP